MSTWMNKMSVVLTGATLLFCFFAANKASAADAVISGVPSEFTKSTSVTLTIGGADLVAYKYIYSYNGTASGESAEYDISIPINLTSLKEGAHQVDVLSKDSADNWQATPTIASWTVDLTPPALQISALADGAYTNISTLNLQGTVSDANGIPALTVNGATVTVSQPDGSFSHPLVLTTGANTVTTVATDVAGNQTSDTRTITLDKTAPALAITTPADNSKTSLIPVGVTGTVDESSTVEVTVTNNGNSVSGSPYSATMSGTSFSASVNVDPGLNTIEVTATDTAQNKVTQKRSVTYDNTQPSLAVTDPAQDLKTKQSSITIRGTVSDALTAVTITITMGTDTFAPTVTNGTFEQLITFPTGNTYQIMVKATDEVGNETTVVRNIIYDGTAPTVISATSATPDGYYNAGKVVAITVNFSEPVTSAGLTIDLNSGASITTGALSNAQSFSGNYTVAAGQNSPGLSIAKISGTITDSVGNATVDPTVGQNFANRKIVIDTTPPDTTITAQPPNPTNQTSATFSFSSSKPTGATFECSLDGGTTPAYVACTTPSSYSALSAGSHTFHVRAIDQAGNVDQAPATYSWTVDTTAPTVVSATSTTGDGYYKAGKVIDITLTFSKPVSSSGLTIALDSGASITTGPLTGATSYSGNYTVADGQNSPGLSITKITGTITDSGGNATVDPTFPGGQNFANRKIVIDTTPPDTTITAQPPNPTNQTSSSFSFSSSKPTGAIFECSLDGGTTPAYVSCTTPSSYSALAAGSHTFRVRAIDQAGNVDQTPATYSWSVDTTAPTVVSVTSTTGDGYYKAGKVINITLTFSKPVSSSGLTIALNSGASITTGPLTGATSYSGSYTVAASQTSPSLSIINPLTGTITDAATNATTNPDIPDGRNLSDSKVMVIDTTAPQVNAGGNQIRNGTFTQVATATDDNPQTYIWSKQAGSGTISFGSATALTTPVTATADGTYTLRFTVTDAAGNSAFSDMNLVWDTEPPNTSISTQPLELSNKVAVSFKFSSTETGSTFECSLESNNPYSPCQSPASFTLADGGHSFSVRAIDQAGNTDPTPASYAWTIDTIAPALAFDPSTPSDGSFTNNGTLLMKGSVSDAGTGVKSFTIKGTAVPPASDGSFSYSLALAAGANVITTIATDNAGNQTSDTRTVHYDTTAPSITITAPAVDTKTNIATIDVTGTVGKPSTVVITVTNNGNPVTGSPYNATMTNYDFKAAAVNLGSGVNTIGITATDTVVGNSATVTRTVTFDNQPPSLTVTVPATDITTNQSSLTVKGTVSDTQTTVSVTVSKDTETVSTPVVNGAFEQTITFAAENPYLIAVKATDAAGNETLVQRKVTFVTTKPVISFTEPVDSSKPTDKQTVTNKQTVTVKGSVDKVNTTVTMQVNGSPQPIGLNSNSFSAQATLAPGDNTITIIDKDQAGNIGSNSFKITYDETLPSLIITSPSQILTRSPLDKKSMTITGTVSDARTAVSVTITIDPDPIDKTKDNPLTQTVTYNGNIGTFNQDITFSEQKVYLVVVKATDGGGNETTDQRRILFGALDGNLDGKGEVDVLDALQALRIAVGLDQMDDKYLVHGDVAPLVEVDGKFVSVPNNKIDVGDAVVILKKIVEKQ